MDLADASLVAIAETLRLRKVFTLDSDFRIYRTQDGGAFEIVPEENSRQTDPQELPMFDGLKNLGNLPGLMAKAKEMQDKMKSMQDDLARKQVVAEAGGGMVQATVNGRLELVKLKIDKSRIDPQDTEMLEDVIVAAVAAAQNKAGEAAREQMQKMTSDLGLPPGMLP